MWNMLSRVMLGLSLVLLALPAPPAAAHADYARSEPGTDALVATAPAQVRVWFTQEPRTQGSQLEVVDAAGNRVDRGDGRVDLNDPDRKLMLVSLNAVPNGVYTVRWRVVSSEDGDTTDGAFRFGVGVAALDPPAPSPAASPPAAGTPEQSD